MNYTQLHTTTHNYIQKHPIGAVNTFYEFLTLFKGIKKKKEKGMKDKRNHHGIVVKSNSFVNLLQLTLLCASGSYVRQASWLDSKMKSR